MGNSSDGRDTAEEHFFDIVCEINDLPYAAFCQKIKWNVLAIAGYEKACGYIIQMVHYTDTTGVTRIFDDYYEAWPVQDGVCEHADKYEYDDNFSFDGDPSRPVKESIGKVGCIRYETKVYWIDKTDSLYDVINSWKEREVLMAGNLKSKYAKECTALTSATPRFLRKFEHRFDCRLDSDVEAALRYAYATRIKRKDSTLREFLSDLLADTNYRHLVGKICSYS